MSDVKRYDPINSDGTCGTCVEDPDYGAYVEFADYAALEAELATVKKVAYGNMELLDENRNLQAELAKLLAGQESLLLNLADQKRQADEYRSMWAKAVASSTQPSAVPESWRRMDASFVIEHIRQTSVFDADLIEQMLEYAIKGSAPSAPATVQGDGWIPVSERLPESERTVLAFYLNSHGKGRRVRAEYIAAKTKSADDGWDSDEPADYDEQADEYFWPAGWYEVMDNWDDLTHMVIHEGEVTHWMPLPESPAIAAARQGGGK